MSWQSTTGVVHLPLLDTSGGDWWFISWCGVSTLLRRFPDVYRVDTTLIMSVMLIVF